MRATALSTLLALGLSGCLVQGAGTVILPHQRADIPWIEGRYGELNPSEHNETVEAVVTRVDTGLYRFTSAGGDWPEYYRRAFRALLGVCPEGLDQGLEPLASEVEESPDDLRRLIEAACEGDVATVCEDEDMIELPGVSCRDAFARLSGRTAEPPLSRAAEEGLDAYRWLGLGLPHRDDVLFSTADLGDFGAPGWALVEVHAIAGRGRFTGVQPFQPPLVTGDLILVHERTPETDESGTEVTGVDAWATAQCFAETRPTLDRADAIEALAACARRIEGAADAEVGLTPSDTQSFRRLTPAED